MRSKRAVVLSGGGAKGGYEIGAWQALRELDYTPDIVTGTSVGAFNGALIALNKYEEALDLWQSIGMDSVFLQFSEAVKNDESKLDGYITRLAKEAILKGGADYTPLHHLITSIIDEDMLRKSTVDFGLVTTTFPYKRQVELFIEDIPRGKAVDYIIASASCFPLVKSYKIGNTKFIDGGYSNNLPIQMALNRGAEEIVAVNIGKMTVKKLKENCAEIHYVKNIRPFNEDQFGTIAIFDKELSMQNIRQGYLDTCKAFKILDGFYYSFEIYERYNVCKYERICEKKFSSVFSVLPSDSMFERTGKQKIVELLSSYENDPFGFNTNVLSCAEIAAELFNFNPREIYTLQGMVDRLIIESIALLSEDSAGNIAELTRQLDKGFSLDLLFTIKKSWDKKLIIGFCLQLFLEEKLELVQKRRLWVIASLMPDVFCAALFCCSAILTAGNSLTDEIINIGGKKI